MRKVKTRLWKFQNSHHSLREIRLTMASIASLGSGSPLRGEYRTRRGKSSFAAR